MKLPVVQAKELIASAKYPWLDNIYQTSIPKEVQDDVDENKENADSAKQTFVWITEYANEPEYYANNAFKGWQIGVEVQIFYSLDINLNIQDLEIELAKLFQSDGWQIEQSKNHTKDPDTSQKSKVFYFVKHIRGGI